MTRSGHTAGYAITSSARASSVRGTSTPSALAGLHVEDKLVPGRRLQPQVGRLLAPEDAIDVACCAAPLVGEVGPVRSQATASDEIAGDIHGG
jgi:hypothetical protein